MIARKRASYTRNHQSRTHEENRPQLHGSGLRVSTMTGNPTRPDPAASARPSWRAGSSRGTRCGPPARAWGCHGYVAGTVETDPRDATGLLGPGGRTSLCPSSRASSDSERPRDRTCNQDWESRLSHAIAGRALGDIAGDADWKVRDQIASLIPGFQNVIFETDMKQAPCPARK